jgi:hypothetical protein
MPQPLWDTNLCFWPCSSCINMRYGARRHGEDRIPAGDLDCAGLDCTAPWSRLRDLRIQLHIQPHHSYGVLGNRLGMLTNNTNNEGLIMLTRCCVSGLLACLALTSRRPWGPERSRGEEPKLLFSAKKWVSLDEHHWAALVNVTAQPHLALPTSSLSAGALFTF